MPLTHLANRFIISTVFLKPLAIVCLSNFPNPQGSCKCVFKSRMRTAVGFSEAALKGLSHQFEAG
jgi:hypothetical protein